MHLDYNTIVNTLAVLGLPKHGLFVSYNISILRYYLPLIHSLCSQ